MHENQLHTRTRSSTFSCDLEKVSTTSVHKPAMFSRVVGKVAPCLLAEISYRVSARRLIKVPSATICASCDNYIPND